MQNVVYVYNDFGNGREEVVYYKEIFSEFDRPAQYPKDGFLNIILTSHTDSLFDLKVDLYSTYKDGAYLFSLNRLPLKSDKIVDYTEFKRELLNYLRIYLDMQYRLVKTPEDYVYFQFKHNLPIKEKILNRTINFFNKYVRGGLWSIHEPKNIFKKRINTEFSNTECLLLLDDLLKTILSFKNLNEKYIFFLSSMIYLPLDIILHVIPLVFPKDHSKKIYFFYKLSEIMISRGKFNLGYLYSLQAVNELKQTLNIKMAEYFLEKSRSIRKSNKWRTVLNDVVQTLEIENRKTFGDVIWERPSVDKQDLKVSKLSVVASNSIYRQDDCVFNLKKDKQVCLESLRIEIEVESDAFLEEIILELVDKINECDIELDKQIILPVYRDILIGKNTFLLPICFQNELNSRTFKLKEFVFKNHKSNLNYPTEFTKIKRKHSIQLQDIYFDEKYVLYCFLIDKTSRIFTFCLMKSEENVLICYSKEEKKTFLYEISDKYVEKINLN